MLNTELGMTMSKTWSCLFIWLPQTLCRKYKWKRRTLQKLLKKLQSRNIATSEASQIPSSPLPPPYFKYIFCSSKSQIIEVFASEHLWRCSFKIYLDICFRKFNFMELWALILTLHYLYSWLAKVKVRWDSDYKIVQKCSHDKKKISFWNYIWTIIAAAF